MNSLKTHALLGAGALALVSAMGPTAQAATVFGGSSTMFAPIWAQEAYCYDGDPANQTMLTPTGSATLSATTATGCPKNTGVLIRVDATGSAIAQAGLYANSPVASLFGSGAGAVSSTVQYGLSGIDLVGADLAAYDKGTGATETFAFMGDTATATAPPNLQGLTFSANPASATNFPIPKAKYGPLVQFPVAVDPLAITFNANYTSSNGVARTFNIKNGGVLHLSKSTYCGIFTGAITNWNDPALTADNANTSLKATADIPPFSVPIKLIGRSDSSGATSVFTRHLAAVCGSSDYTSGTATLPSTVSALFTTVAGDSGMASAIHSTMGSIGYIGADYVVPNSANVGATTFSLVAAALQNNAGNFVQPTATAALAAFGSIAPPQSNADGSFNVANNSSDRRDPTQWVQSTAANAPLANPSASIAAAYPIVGTTNFIGYTCYASANSVSILQGFLTFGQGPTTETILKNAGLAPLPSQWETAIRNTFLSASATDGSAGLHLYMAATGATGSTANPACAVSGVIGG